MSRRGPRSVAGLWRSSAVRYVVVGGLAFLIDVGLLALLHDVGGVPLAAATPIAFLTSFAITYLLQRLLTFRSNARLVSSSLKYAALVAVNAVATTLIVTSTVSVGWPWEVGKVVAVVLTTVWNYFGYRYWIFRDRTSAGPGSGPTTP